MDLIFLFFTLKRFFFCVNLGIFCIDLFALSISIICCVIAAAQTILRLCLLFSLDSNKLENHVHCLCLFFAIQWYQSIVVILIGNTFIWIMEINMSKIIYLNGSDYHIWKCKIKDLYLSIKCIYLFLLPTNMNPQIHLIIYFCYLPRLDRKRLTIPTKWAISNLV